MSLKFEDQLQQLLRKVYYGDEYKRRLLKLRLIQRLYPLKSYEDLLKVPMDLSLPEDVRCLACWMLCHFDRHEAPKILGELYDLSGKTMQFCIVKSLSHLKLDASVDILLKGLNNPDTNVRKMSAYSLGNIGNSQIRAKEISDNLIDVATDDDEDVEVRTVAIEAIGLTRVHKAQAKLMKLLQHSDLNIRFWTAYALGKFADKMVIPYLEKVVSSDVGYIDGLGSISDEAKNAIISIRSRESYNNES